MIDIQNRRYIGNKRKLLNNIENIVSRYFGDSPIIFGDIFAGTGVVGYHFANSRNKVIVNDILYSNYVPYKAWFSEEHIDIAKLQEILDKFNNLDMTNLDNNYFSDIYANKYFSEENAKAIGFIREEIEEYRDMLSEREYFVLLTSLLYYADRTANTVGHFESFLKQTPSIKPLNLEMLKLDNISNVEIYKKDANSLISDLECDVVYIDPPYNARQYINFYHVLENLAQWEKPMEFEGNSMKFKRNHLKSGYSQAKAPMLFEELINKTLAKIIIVSYNNTYSAKSNASNNKITEEQLESILKKKGKVRIEEIEYKSFNSGKTDFKNHLEKLYICEVGEHE